MAQINGSYNTETGEFTVTVDGKELPNVNYFSISAPIGYDNDADDNDNTYGPAVRCNITTYEDVGDLKKFSNYTNATEKSKADIADGLAKPSKIPGFIEELHIAQSIDRFLHGGD